MSKYNIKIKLACIINLTLTLLIHITHWKKKYTRTATAGGLNGLRSAKKDVKNLQEQKKALTKIITIQLNQERKGQSEKTYN